MNGIKVKFWGVRGSIPAPGPSTQGVGGNTSCVELRLDDQVLVLDAGTGALGLGRELAKEGVTPASVLFSHVHWDHIQGFPYFAPAAQGGRQLVLFGERKDGAGIDDILVEQARQAQAPLVPAKGGAEVVFEALKASDQFELAGAQIKTVPLNHPDGCVGYRVDFEGASLLYATDTEHLEGQVDAALVEAARDVDVLIYDAMYTEKEYLGAVGPSKKGWGHSTWQAGVEVAKAANARRLILFHHEPSHDDECVAQIESSAQKDFPQAVAAREGLSIDLIG